MPTRVYGQAGDFGTVMRGCHAGTFNQPLAAALDSDGNLYVAEPSRVLYFPAGQTIATRVYGRQGDFGPAHGTPVCSADSLEQAMSVALDVDDNLYVIDRHRVLFFPKGQTTATRVYGQGGRFDVNLPWNEEPYNGLSSPNGLCLHPNGDLMVADTQAHRLLRFVAGTTQLSAICPQPAARHAAQPMGLVMDRAGRCLTGDIANDRILAGPKASTPDALKLALLQQHAPQLRLAAGEPYLPVSVAWAQQFLMPWRDVQGRPWQRLKRAWDDMLNADPGATQCPLFEGNLAQAEVYGFWSEHAEGVNLCYFFFYGYNRGKDIAGSVFGNHVMDIEHIVVRLNRPNIAAAWKAQSVYYASHEDGRTLGWHEAPAVDGHPIVYAAWGSHGCYPASGEFDVNLPSTIYNTVAEVGNFAGEVIEKIPVVAVAEEVGSWLGIDRSPGPLIPKYSDICSDGGEANRLADGPEGPQYKGCFGPALN